MFVKPDALGAQGEADVLPLLGSAAPGAAALTPLSCRGDEDQAERAGPGARPRGLPPECRRRPARAAPRRARTAETAQRLQKSRRLQANNRERTRMHNLNAALDALRDALPTFPEDARLTKIETLRFAHNYIWALTETLRLADPGPPRPEPAPRSLAASPSPASTGSCAHSPPPSAAPSPGSGAASPASPAGSDADSWRPDPRRCAPRRPGPRDSM